MRPLVLPFSLPGFLLILLLILLSPASHAISSSPVIVAIIDTGMDLNHPALRDHLWTNPGETGVDRWGHRKETNGIDDDDNGFVDDLHGWNFISHNNDVSDHHGHGTHIAGIISRLAPQAKLMILKYYDASAPAEVSVQATPPAIRYARRMQAQIVNYSGGGPGQSRIEFQAISQLEAQGVLFVAAAGNEAQNSDQAPFYPADYGLKNILSVTAMGANLHLLPSSNYGLHSVQIAAPGEHIRSTVPGGGFGEMSGTSQATAYVTGVAALKLSTLPKNFKPTKLIDILLSSGKWNENLKMKLKAPVMADPERILAIKSENQDAQGNVTENAAKLDERLFLSGHAYELLTQSAAVFP
jgi:subtilisin family serine protease